MSFNKQNQGLKDRQALEEEIKKDLERLADVSRTMLIDTRYRKIKEIFERAEQNTIQLLMRFYKKESDPIKYKAKMDEYLIELDVFRHLLQVPLDFANPKPKPNLNFMQRFLEGYKKDLTEAVETE